MSGSLKTSPRTSDSWETSHLENSAFPVFVRCTPSLANQRSLEAPELAFDQSRIVRFDHRAEASERFVFDWAYLPDRVERLTQATAGAPFASRIFIAASIDRAVSPPL